MTVGGNGFTRREGLGSPLVESFKDGKKFSSPSKKKRPAGFVLKWQMSSVTKDLEII